VPVNATTESRWVEQTSDELREAGRRRFIKKLSFADGGVGRSVHLEVVVEAQHAAPPEDAMTDDFYDWLEHGVDIA
jgi:hypothetical protein